MPGLPRETALTLEDQTRRAAAAVDQDRLWKRQMAMAAIGRIEGGGVNRQCLSPEDIEARALLIEWAKARGYRIAVDPIANLFLRRPGRDPDADPVVVGSHMDSQPQGGRFDGIFGVLAGLETLEALDEAGIETERPVEVVAWTNEEGGRFAPGAMGSAVFTGELALERCLELTDATGIRFGDVLAQTLAATPEAERRQLDLPIAAYLEPHIEQGPLLESSGHQIGIVSGIQGARWYTVDVEGETAHAGTVPLRDRKDALRAAVAVIAALQEMMHDGTDETRFTVGRLEVSPNSPNTVPARVTFSIDFRHPSEEALERRGAKIESICRRFARPCAARVSQTFRREPCIFPTSILGAIERAADALALPYMRLQSGAFHDANFLADVCPSGMIFVPCERGISHSPAENAKPEDLAAGTRLTAATVVEIAAREQR
jgi:N-carbamoyl-L-amino-acid hydrolase